MEGLPLLLICSGLGIVKGQPAQESESQQIAATLIPNAKITKKTGKMKKKMGAGWEDNLNLNPLTCPGGGPARKWARDWA